MRLRNSGFTLAELLIALAILGVIATFTIPKVLNSSTSSKNTAIAKEAASMVSGAFQSYSTNTSVASGTTAGVLTQYMNYVKTDTATTFSAPTSGTKLDDCSGTLVCLQLHNGGILQYSTSGAFNTTNTTSAVLFNLDPDGTGTGAGAVTFIQFLNGRLTTRGNVAGVADYSTTPGLTTVITTDPSYLSNWAN